jgi:hypothetical protein
MLEDAEDVVGLNTWRMWWLKLLISNLTFSISNLKFEIPVFLEVASSAGLEPAPACILFSAFW